MRPRRGNRIPLASRSRRYVMVHQIDPLRDPRWAEFVQRHPRASVFHTPGWLNALQRTYGYEPVAYTTSTPRSELTNGLVACRVRSSLTGKRIVSLPFSDHCEPLVDRAEERESLLEFLEREAEAEGWRYVELRSVSPLEDHHVGFRAHRVFYGHRIALHRPASELFCGLSKTRCQQMIRRAERMQLSYEEGRSAALVNTFYDLFRRTRRRHALPPQPITWFETVADCLGEKAKVRVVAKDGVPVASLFTLAHTTSMVEKYSCSDERFHNLGGVALLLWKTIQEAKDTGLAEFDLGRSDPDAHGLISFKEGWGAIRNTLTYYRCPPGRSLSRTDGWPMRIARGMSRRLPDSVLAAAGKLLYRHIA